MPTNCCRSPEPNLSHLRMLPLALGLVLAACGGGSDPLPDAAVGSDALVAENDTAPAPGGGGDAGTDVSSEPNCVGVANGVVCAEGNICLDQVCTPSRCGDGIVDMLLGEECDDKNELSGDGCGLCRWECKTNDDCSDGNTCNGTETCELATHICKVATPAANGVACTITPATAGVCREGGCVKPGCGNSTVDAGEDCDDGNTNDADGCTSECRFTCTKNDDCNNGNACDGVETCELASHTCKAGTAVTCMANGCAGTCEPSDGLCKYPDADKDGSTCDLDCNDADPAVFPGGFECKDGKDNDCNPATIDATAPSCECYVDTDKDGFAQNVTGAIPSPGACPTGYTRTKPVDAKTIDCAPRIPNAFPGQTTYFPTGYCPTNLCFVGAKLSFDYNCDNAESSSILDNKLAAATCASATTPFNCSLASGWIGNIPVCGGKATYRLCTFANKKCGGTDIPNRARACR